MLDATRVTRRDDDNRERSAGARAPTVATAACARRASILDRFCTTPMRALQHIEHEAPMIHLWSSVRRMRACTRNKLALVVDSDDAFRQVAMRALLRAGCSSVGMSSADEALRWLGGAPQPLVLVAVDAHLENGDGVALCASIRATARGAGVPILCSSSLPDLDDRLRVLRAGADVFLPKPVPPEVFFDAAARLLQSGGHAHHAGQAFISSRRM